MLDILWAIIAVVGAIMILVFVHEMGHFLFAKLFKMRVDRFSVGFPPKIVGKKIGETEYVIGATPLGGYVKIAGMVDESMDTDFAASEPEPWEFRAKPVWQRIIVICAGVTFNVILAAIIFIGLKYAYGETRPLALEDGSVYVADSSLAYETIGLRTGDRILAISGQPFDPNSADASMVDLLADSLTITVDRDGQRLVFTGPDDIMTQIADAGSGGLFGLGLYNEPSVVGEVIEGRPAQAANLQTGDRIVSINGQPVRFWVEITQVIQNSGGQPLDFEWIRPGVSGETATDTPGALPGTSDGRYRATIAAAQDEDGQYRIGIGLPERRETFGFGEAISVGVSATWLNTKAIVINLRRIFTGRENIRKNLGGPVMVAKITGQAAQRGGEAFWTIVALLSITLAIVNILPIPALDGGHLVFLLYEGITRREPSLKVRMVTQQVGMVLLLTLMAFLVFNDILRL